MEWYQPRPQGFRVVHTAKMLSEDATPPKPSNKLRSNDADGKENFKQTIGFISKTTNLHVHRPCLYISLPVFARLRRRNAFSVTNSNLGAR